MTADETDLLEQIASTEPVDSTETAREVVEATMETLGERITGGQAADLAATLPDVAAEPLREARPREAEELSLAAFVARVDERTNATDDGDDPVQPVDLIRAALTGSKRLPTIPNSSTRETNFPERSTSFSNPASC